MVSEYGIKLANHLITSHFGNIVSTICECLLRKGMLPIGQIRRYTELSEDKIRKGLLVLIQHNCVQAFVEEQEGGFGQGNRKAVQYMALFDHIIHRMRFAKFMVLVREKHGEECEEVLEGLLQHGRLTLEQIIDRAKATKRDATISPDPVRERFMELVSARFVERCPEPEPFIALPTEEEKKSASKTKRPRLEPIEERAILAASHMDSKRFQVLTDVAAINEEDKDMTPTTEANGKRKKDAIDLDERADDSNYEKEVLWRVNFEEFVRCFRHKACVENVRSRLDDGAAIVCSAILEATKLMETKVKTKSSEPLSLSTIEEEVRNGKAGHSMTPDHIRTSLAQLDCWPSDNNKLYSLDLSKIIELARNDEVESIVQKRYGQNAYKIFRLLLKDYRPHESDKISDITFVEKKDTNKILYSMWKDEYLHLEKVQVSTPKQLTFTMWKIIKEPLWMLVLDEMYHAALNLNQRGAYELEQAKELLMLPKEKLEGPLLEKYNRLVEVKKLLDSSLMKLDGAIMLFHDF